MNAIGIFDAPQPASNNGMGNGLNASFAPAEDDRLSLRRLFHLLRRRVRVFALTVALVISIGLLITMMQPRLYDAGTTVLLKTSAHNLEQRVTDQPEAQELIGDADVNSEIQVIGSLDVARRVVRTLKLVENPRFNPYLDPEPSFIGRIIGSKPDPIDLTKLTPEQRSQMEDQIVRLARSGLNATRVGTSYTVLLVYEHSDPEIAQMLANGFAQQYVESQVSGKHEETAEAGKFLAGKVEELRRQATLDYGAVQKYRIENNLLSSSATALTEQDISVYNQQTAASRAEAAADAARLATARQQLRSGSKGDDVGEALSSSVVSALRTQRAQIAARVADDTTRYGPRHPDLLRAKEELASVDKQIQEEIDRVISNLEAKAAVSSQRVASLNSTLGAAKGELARNNGALVTLDDLQRRAQASQGLYESYLGRYRQIMAGSGTERPEARILTEAMLPGIPSSPNVMLNMALAIMLGLVSGFIVAIASEMQFKGLTTSDDVEKRIGLPFLGITPENGSLEIHGDDALITLIEYPNSMLAESVRGIYAATRMPPTGRATVLAVTSALPGEGKTMLSAMLARTAHAQGVRTVVIDCDIILRGLSRLFDMNEGNGVREVAAGKCDLTAALRLDDGGGFAVLPITSRAEAGERLTGNGAIQAIVAQLKERFDLVVLDCPPLLAIAEAREIAGLADGVLLAAYWRKTPDNAVRSAARLLPERLANYTGVVLSRVDLRKQQRYTDSESTSYTTAYQTYIAASAV